MHREAPTDPRQQALPDPRLQGRSIAQISPNLDPRRNPVPAAPAQFAGPRQHARPSGPPSYPRPQQNVPIGQGLDPRTGHPVGPGFVQGLDPRQRAQAPGQEQRHHSTASAPQQVGGEGLSVLRFTEMPKAQESISPLKKSDARSPMIHRSQPTEGHDLPFPIN